MLKSRKFVFSLFACLLVFAAMLIGHWLPEVVSLYPSFVSAITALAGLYLAGNVAQKVWTKAPEPPPEPRHEHHGLGPGAGGSIPDDAP